MTPMIRPLRPDELNWANACYLDVDFKPSTPADLIVVAEVGGSRAGLGRLVPIANDSAELGGICVLPPYRGQHLARAIIGHLLLHSPYRTLYCIPFAHLEALYRSFDFMRVSGDTEPPPAIAAKLGWCRQRYASEISLLVRTGAAATLKP